MASQSRVGVVYAPLGAASLRDVYASATGICDVVIVMRRQIATQHPKLVAAAEMLFDEVVIWDDGATLINLGLDGLTTFHDNELDAVDRELAVLSLPGVGDRQRPWDKLLQRQRLNAVGASRLPIVAVSSRADFRAALESVGCPAVLKPRRGASGSGIALIETQQDVAFQVEHRTAWNDLLLERMLDRGSHPSGVTWLGDFVSVETENVGTQRRHVAMFDKVPVSIARRSGVEGADRIRVTGDIAPSRLSAQHRQLVLDRVSRALDALGVTWRFTHTEVWLSASDAQVIEVNGRVGGHLNRVLRLVRGPDMIRSALLLCMGQKPQRPPDPQPGLAAGVFPVFTSSDSHVAAQVSPADLRRLPGVVGVDEVAVHGTLRSENGFRAANVTLKAATAPELDQNIQALHEGMARLFAADGAISNPWRSAREAVL